MSKLTYKASYYALYAMFAVILIVMVLFFLGGSATGDAAIPGIDPEMWQPAQTDALLYLIYALFGIAIAATKSLLGLVLMVVVLFVTWAIGDGTPMNIRGYEGADNVTFWLKITDMFLYTIYILLFVTIVAIITSGIKKKIS